MRRVAAIAAIVAICASTAAVAAGPFDQLSNRVRQYDEQNSASTRSNRGDRAGGYQAASPNQGNAPIPEGADWDGDWDGPYDDCDSCGPCGCGGLGLWARAEYLYWWVPGASTPPLVATSTTDTISADSPVLFGAQRINKTGRSGGRFT